MTAQIPDSFLLQNKEFSIAGVDGTGLFDPATYHLRAQPGITSCWRGYVCTYKTVEENLLLDRLHVNLGHAGPVINNIHPVFAPKGTFDNIYRGLDLRMDFTGSLLVADGFIRELYVHMGFHPAWKYKTVFELAITRGRVDSIDDVSREMAALRDQMTRQSRE